MELKDRIKGEETNDCQTEGGENRQLPTEILDFRTDSTKLYHLSQSLRKAFPFNFQLTLQTEAQWALEETQRIIGDDGTILLAVLNKVGYGTFGRFFGFLGLTVSQMEHGLHSFYEEWDEDEVDCPPDIPSGIKWFVDAINIYSEIAKDIVLSTSKILSLSKESLINDFVIPFYKIPKSSSLDLRDLAEAAFEKGLERTLWVGAKNCFTVYDCFNLLDTADFVSIFEYFLEQQDEVLKAEEEKRIQRIRWNQTKEQANAICFQDFKVYLEALKTSGLPEEIFQLFSEEKGCWGYRIRFGMLLDLRSILDAESIPWDWSEICDFLQAFGLAFDGDAEACFYETWDRIDLEEAFGLLDSEDQEDAVLWLKDGRGGLLEAVREWNETQVLDLGSGWKITPTDFISGRLEMVLGLQGVHELPKGEY